ncbi:uncharacterized protein M421DRAFT_346145 [Didymella exigua CBS 183.55]|uniref:Uncharacterized protein n=1 Tax=Didymella exigua CBS 183.55 TaxID=1150837 RepID=A0A6A5RSE8_9PLEO|nr:uncharacterized protein M421DRAFT_346145 [Didymella exigua CBS 183.55]KAF1931381.1 hypothetical protein M421DRAFT_346145 [Didymella exigua CBS 183.55]
MSLICSPSVVYFTCRCKAPAHILEKDNLRVYSHMSEVLNPARGKPSPDSQHQYFDHPSQCQYCVDLDSSYENARRGPNISLKDCYKINAMSQFSIDIQRLRLPQQNTLPVPIPLSPQHRSNLGQVDLAYYHVIRRSWFIKLLKKHQKLSIKPFRK